LRRSAQEVCQRRLVHGEAGEASGFARRCGQRDRAAQRAGHDVGRAARVPDQVEQVLRVALNGLVLAAASAVPAAVVDDDAEVAGEPPRETRPVTPVGPRAVHQHERIAAARLLVEEHGRAAYAPPRCHRPRASATAAATSG
jgi:hypothetical protein